MSTFRKKSSGPKPKTKSRSPRIGFFYFGKESSKRSKSNQIQSKFKAF